MKRILKILIYKTLLFISFFVVKKKKKLQPDKIKSILIVNFGLIGDGLLITPLVTALQNKFKSKVNISLLVTPWSYVAIKNFPNTEKFIYEAFWADPKDNHEHKLKFNHIIDTLKIIKMLKQNSFDIIINTWFGDQPLTAILLRLLKSRNIIGFDFKYASNFYDIKIPFEKGKHIIENLNNVYKYYFGEGEEELPNNTVQYYFGENLRDEIVKIIDNVLPYILISPFTSEKIKFWELKNWTYVLKYLHKNYPRLNIVISGTKEFYKVSENWMKEIHFHVENLVGKTNFDEFAYLAKNAKLIVSVDSSVVHLASSFEVPIFVLYCRAYDYRQLLPYSTKCGYSIVDVDCAECIVGCDKPICMYHKPEVVVNKIKIMLDEIEDKILVKN